MARVTDFGDGPRVRLVTDNNDRHWIIDVETETRFEVAGPGSGQWEAATALYGEPETGVFLTGWNEGPDAIDLFGGPNQMELVVAGHQPDPITGQVVDQPQEITTASGVTYSPIEGTVPGEEEHEGGYVGTPDGSPPSGSPQPTPPGPDPEREAAKDEVRRTLEQWGLEGLADEAWDQIVEGSTPTQVVQWVRETDDYHRRFPGMEERRRQGHPAISEQEYIEYERQLGQLERQADVPGQMLSSPDAVAEWIGQDVSLSEIEARVIQGYDDAMRAPEEVRQQLRSIYGLGDGDLAAFFMDPDRAWSTIEQEYRASRAAGAAAMTGFGELRRDQAERMAELGVEFDQAREGFGQISDMGELTDRLPGERAGEAFSRDDLIEAQFAGDARIRRRLQRQAERRRAAFEGGGRAGGMQTGITGLGRGTIRQ